MASTPRTEILSDHRLFSGLLGSSLGYVFGEIFHDFTFGVAACVLLTFVLSKVFAPQSREPRTARRQDRDGAAIHCIPDGTSP
ncbi:hypothetical protein [Streptomyces sp. N35]|uniref:hypothetical protein n=1 Tax=Streptomyces sp. N35 TaxID=2795730 RepID=UPI0018F3AAD8|nr:hypothetical protein [Streptomyces sp. N35]